ncbi:hypothetical protein PJ311_07720 [Bacillus sp. CLL-7-23]|uniref:TetR family transcriptional regulator n=1 Tax=Bacillus changyiensis TaxID=3004103 RepID=A0ABT4X2I2_9BACI|nr:hypothetical protein [Bacillus changyiensis]MDA7026503.1 hypothetical protein [Bacillus changyiensis]
MEQNKLVIMNEKFKKEGSEEEIEGLTIMVDGIMKQAFDIIKINKNYDTYTEVMRDVIFAGIKTIVDNDRK